MTDPATRFWIATRKGLFAAERGAQGWGLQQAPSFLGEPVTMVLPDPRDGHLYAALRLGHFGVKLHRSADQGRTWQEIAAPAYPPKPADRPGAEPDKTPWSTDLVWSLAAGGPSQPGRLWAGTIPGGLFRSDDHGEHWSLVESLWQRPERAKWFGGGYDHAGIHSICVDPRDPRRLRLAVSCGGVWGSEDDGANWTLLGEGLCAEYMPPEGQNDLAIQDPHLIAASLAAGAVGAGITHAGCAIFAPGLRRPARIAATCIVGALAGLLLYAGQRKWMDERLLFVIWQPAVAFCIGLGLRGQTLRV